MFSGVTTIVTPNTNWREKKMWKEIFKVGWVNMIKIYCIEFSKEF